MPGRRLRTLRALRNSAKEKARTARTAKAKHARPAPPAPAPSGEEHVPLEPESSGAGGVTVSSVMDAALYRGGRIGRAHV